MRTCMLIMSIVLASAVLQAQPLVVYTSEQLDPRSDRYCPYCVFKVQESEKRAREGGTPTHVRVYTPEQLDPRSDKYCPYCVFKLGESEKQAREGGIPTHVRVYTPEQLDPRSDKYCPYCVFKVNEAERQAREREITDAAWDALRQFDRLRERSRRN